MKNLKLTFLLTFLCTQNIFANDYRGEAGLHLSGLISNEGSTAFVPEVRSKYWPETIFGWNNYYLSKDRWGMDANFQKILPHLAVKNYSGIGTTDTSISSATANLKYNFTPGVWEKDDTFGAIASYEYLHFGAFDVPKIGAGIYWSRSMPAFLDNAYNLVPWFRHPKWMKIDFKKYWSAKSKYSLSSDYSINLSNKIFWNENIFGELDLGAKKYYFIRKADQKGATLNTYSATLGFGIKF